MVNRCDQLALESHLLHPSRLWDICFSVCRGAARRRCPGRAAPPPVSHQPPRRPLALPLPARGGRQQQLLQLFSLFLSLPLPPPPQSSHKTFKIKRYLAKKQKQNRPIPQWIRMKTGNKIRYNSKRRHWRRTKLGL
ncbi:60S ribosomal protein L39 [Alligator sinensis]|uniref:Large ribosomal subunit protein eL39 n=1 Tax=Alligator sinensis TaxID=38654 RepID=A0A3Q0H5L8_ALLSI|nr:60S ribosomal protein L39 [Alligator sinensis]